MVSQCEICKNNETSHPSIGMYSAHHLSSQRISLNFQAVPFNKLLHNVGVKLWVKVYYEMNQAICNGMKNTIWRKFWHYKPLSNYLNMASQAASVLHLPCKTVNLQNCSIILRLHNTGKFRALNQLERDLTNLDATKVMASTTIYTIEHVMAEKSMRRDDRRKSSLKKGKCKCKCKHKEKHVRDSGPEPPSKEAEPAEDERKNLDEILKDIDAKLDKHQEMEKCLRRLMKLNKKHPKEPKILWRIGKAYQKFAEMEKDVETKLNHVEKGIEACRTSLDMIYEQADAHKWMAILVGYKGQFQSTKEKIYCGKLFKKHLDIAILLNPSDPVLQHMAGRFCLEFASLSWVERKIAKQVFSDPINCSIDIALDHFLQAEKFMGQGEWKENKLLIAKCHIMKEDYEKALEWLDEARKANDDSAGEMVEKEIEELLQKYSKYR